MAFPYPLTDSCLHFVKGMVRLSTSKGSPSFPRQTGDWVGNSFHQSVLDALSTLQEDCIGHLFSFSHSSLLTLEVKPKVGNLFGLELEAFHSLPLQSTQSPSGSSGCTSSCICLLLGNWEWEEVRTQPLKKDCWVSYLSCLSFSRQLSWGVPPLP